jgi:acyl-coenzyme A thioesterase PaaI-like protein
VSSSLSSAPAGVARPEPHPDAPAPGTVLPAHFVGCFACGELEGGLRMRFVAGDALTVRGEFTVHAHHQGAPGIAHGGVLSAAFDEGLGFLQTHLREPAVTASLRTEFLRPVPVGTVLHLQCRIEGREGRKIWTSGTGTLGADGPLAIRAEALFVTVPAEHFVRHSGPAAAATESYDPSHGRSA